MRRFFAYHERKLGSTFQEIPILRFIAFTKSAPVLRDLDLLIEADNFFKVPVLVNCNHRLLKVVFIICNLRIGTDS